MGWNIGADDYQFNDSGTTFATVNPMTLSGGELKLATSTNEFDLDGSNQLSVKLNNSLTSNDGGIAVATTTDYVWTGDHTFARTTTTGKVIIGTSSLENATSTLNIIGDTYITGNATTTGSMDVGELCFDGGTCETAAGSKYLYRNFVPVTVENTTDETTLYSFNVPGGLMGTNNTLRITLIITDFDYEGSSAGGSGISIKVKYDDSTISDMDTGNGCDGAIDNYKGTVESFMTASSSAAEQISFGNMFLSLATISDGSPAFDAAAAYANPFASAEDSTTDLTMTVTADWGAADAQSILTVGGILVELIR